MVHQDHGFRPEDIRHHLAPIVEHEPVVHKGEIQTFLRDLETSTVRPAERMRKPSFAMAVTSTFGAAQPTMTSATRTSETSISPLNLAAVARF